MEAAAQLPCSYLNSLRGSRHLHWYSMDAKGPEPAGWWSRLGTSGQAGSSLLKVWQTQLLRVLWHGQDACCVYAEGSDTDSRNTSWEHTFTLWLLIGNFYSSKILSFVKENEWAGILQNILIGSNSLLIYMLITSPKSKSLPHKLKTDGCGRLLFLNSINQRLEMKRH